MRMTLEDHAGDVIRKSRAMKNVTLDAAAGAAGCTASDLSRFEDDGRLNVELNWVNLAAMLDLNAIKLERVARGWLPVPPKLETWPEFRQLTTVGPTMSVHAYLVWDEVTREAAMFDTGFDPQPLFEVIEKEDLSPQFLFITHMHGDHVAGLEKIRERFPKIKLRTESTTAPLHCRNRRNDFIHLGGLRITNRDTPGHAEDGVTYVVGNFPEDAPNIAIVGDAIFAGSIGGAPNHGDLAKHKVREQILSLPDATLIGPGHGPLTTVGQEKENNPFF